MKEIVVREVYKVDTISKDNENAWNVLTGIMDEEDGKVLFDFKGITLVEPWTNMAFRKFISNDRVYMRLYSSRKIAETIELACELGGMKKGRFVNIDVEVPVKITAEEKKILNIANKFQEHIIKDGGKAVFNIYEEMDQIGVVETVNYIKKAIELFLDNNQDVREFQLNTGKISIQTSIIESILEMFNDINDTYGDVNLEITSTDDDVNNKVKLYKNVMMNRTITKEEKYRIIKKELKYKMVGMLTRFKTSKSVDEFGRYGEGIPICCRVAIFEGIVDDLVVFRTFHGNSFYTLTHWMLQNDGEKLRELHDSIVEIPIDELGITNKFIGSNYHFNMPIQRDKKDYDIIYDIDENGKVLYNKVTIPERIQRVLDSWREEYNKEELMKAIEYTKEILGEC